MDQYAVVGNPIAHSQSPFIHQAFAAQCEQELAYRAECAPLEDFVGHMTRLRAAGLKGANVTVPFKLQAFDWVTQRTPRAQAAGAVNTLQFQSDGTILGDNTDGAGLITDLRHQEFEIEGQDLLLLGAGGATQGVLLPLLDACPASITIANRTPAKAQALVDRFTPHARTTRLTACALEALSGPYHGIINGTAASLSGQTLALPSHIMPPDGWVYDMMYGAVLTPFLVQAREKGAIRYADGLGMLVEQAAESFFLWRGVRPQTAPVFAALRARLNSSLS